MNVNEKPNLKIYEKTCTVNHTSYRLASHSIFAFIWSSRIPLSSRTVKPTCCRTHRKTTPHRYRPVGNYRLHNLPVNWQRELNAMDAEQILLVLLILVYLNMVDSACADPCVPPYYETLPSIRIMFEQQKLWSCLSHSAKVSTTDTFRIP